MNDTHGMMVCNNQSQINQLFLFISLDFQSGTIIEQLNQNTHVYQYTLNSMVIIDGK